MRRSNSSLLAVCCVAPTLLTIFAGTASAAGFGQGDVVVEQVGATGSTTALANTATAIFLDEFRTADGAQVQQIALPTAQSGTSLPVTASGIATSEGQITNSGDGQTILVPGYDATVGTTGVAGTTSTAVPRVLGRVGSGGLVDSTTSTNNAFSGNNIRSVTSASIGGVETNLAVGGTSGIVTETEGQSSSTVLSNNLTNLRVVHVYSGTVFASTGSGTAGIYAVSGATATLVPGTTSTSPYGFAFARTGTGATYGTTGADTLYVADDTATAAGGILKFIYNGTAFVADGSIPGTTSAVRGLAVRVGTSGEEIFATTTATSANTLVRAVDTAGTGSLTGTTTSTLATAPTNTVFRGVAFTAPAPATSLPEAPYAVLLPLIGLSAVGVLHVRRSSRRAARSTD